MSLEESMNPAVRLYYCWFNWDPPMPWLELVEEDRENFRLAADILLD